MRSFSAALGLALLAAGSISTATLAEDTSLTESNNQVHVGTGVICDTQDEATDFVRKMSERDPSGALQSVNSHSSSPMACGMATVAFRTGKSVGEVRTAKGSFNIVEIEIVAGSVNGNWRMVPSHIQYTAVALKGYDI